MSTWVNLSIWIGYRLHGGRGALAGALAITVPPMIVVILIAMVFAELSRYRTAHTVVDGIAAAAIGLALSMGLRGCAALGHQCRRCSVHGHRLRQYRLPPLADVAGWCRPSRH